MSAVLIGVYCTLDYTCEEDKEDSLLNPAKLNGIRPSKNEKQKTGGSKRLLPVDFIVVNWRKFKESDPCTQSRN